MANSTIGAARLTTPTAPTLYRFSPFPLFGYNIFLTFANNNQNVTKTRMKQSFYLTVLMLLLGIFTLSSCSDDNDTPSSDVNNSIVGDWQIAHEDLNGDGAIQGIVVHEDGTVTEWMYTGVTLDPYKFGFKTGKWTVNGNHYEMQLPKGGGNYYNVTVAGNDDSLMYLAYNGKTSVIPFHRLANLPDNGDAMLRLLLNLKRENFKMSDLTGYWAFTGEDGKVYNNGFYIDAEGNVTDVETYPYGPSLIQHSIKYHTGKVTLNAYLCTIPYQGTTYELYGVNDSIMLCKQGDSQQAQKFVRQDVPQEIKQSEEIANSKVPDWLLGEWESVHYKLVYGSDIVEDFDIKDSDDWAMQFYHTLSFTSDHQLKRGQRSGYYNTEAFYVNNDVIYIAGSLDDLISPAYGYREEWTILSHTNDEMKLKYTSGDDYKIYTYKRKQ